MGVTKNYKVKIYFKIDKNRHYFVTFKKVEIDYIS